MIEKIIDSLRQSDWSVSYPAGNWVCATHDSLQRGLLFGYLNEMSEDLTVKISEFKIPTWDAIIFCPSGFDSSQLKKSRLPGIQLWYWDLELGNIFPNPPTKKQDIPRMLKQIASGTPVSLNAELQPQKQPIPYFTYAFIGINLLVFLLMTLAGGSENQDVLIAFGAKVNSLIQAGQVWRLLTSMFIHIGYFHLAFNLYALWALGPLTELSYGHGKYFAIYMLSGLGGAMASFLFSPFLSAGASGAIMGLLGAQLFFIYKRPYLWKSGLGMNLVIVILVNLGFGFWQPGIDNFAHLGGLFTGMFMGALLSWKNFIKPKSAKLS
ncbi:putative membrane protein [Desulfosporosinus acidiphilus SJ4]|uniref:Putative membrane protein n=1 Tax=Desulfosporosinus acidiphilus (strain DSM 22704 / JCM 16185 / SJ4) TaxID=646529 RepID=I4D7T0_DESAJ|nr:rhomboid family intramembrane serine protease [Desulfosporosinus acidiphilus]AFM41854.1 putative membrane protein [Desulfosporosinus acidiphilus SJ4]